MQPHNPELHKALLLAVRFPQTDTSLKGHILLVWHGEYKPRVVACP